MIGRPVCKGFGAPAQATRRPDPHEDLGPEAMMDRELDDALSFAFDYSLEALDGLKQVRVRDNEAGDVVWDLDGDLILVP